MVSDESCGAYGRERGGLMLEQIQCVSCGDYEEVQVGTELIAERLCYTCYEERDLEEVGE